VLNTFVAAEEHVGAVTTIVGTAGTALTVAVTAVLDELTQPVVVFLDSA
jgi:hypothetical protein